MIVVVTMCWSFGVVKDSSLWGDVVASERFARRDKTKFPLA